MAEQYLTRAEAAEFVRAKGLPCTRLTLQKLACVGGGPQYHRFGSRVVYKPAALDSWIEERLGAPRASSSEAA